MTGCSKSTSITRSLAISSFASPAIACCKISRELEGIIAAGAGMADATAPVSPAELRAPSDRPSGDELEVMRAMETIDVAEPVKAASTAAAKVTLPDVIVPPADGRRAVATKLVERFALWSGVAGIIPLPFVDLAAVGSVAGSHAPAHFTDLRCPVFRKPRQGAHRQSGRLDNTRRAAAWAQPASPKARRLLGPR